LAHYLRLLQFRRWLLDKTPRDRVRLTTIQQEYTRFHPGPWSTEALLRFWEQEKEEWGRGKEIAQGAHASLKVFLDRKVDLPDSPILGLEITSEMRAWVEGSFTKVVTQVSSEEALLAVYNAALAAGLPAALVQDHGITEFKGVPTFTSVAVGPAFSEAVDRVTGSLKLY